MNTDDRHRNGHHVRTGEGVNFELPIAGRRNIR